ncbi:uncharacterized protein MELLADRAFT_123542 [Melampsora larici-populina 98AG31]|uniref:Secreted protein n=1 Tax=Melampsora larici-populina (strain 98AG31 / pathotype 3-4-7) TaxID=747676 RepID=F4R9M5_MELLP|nr:uncharacterized protein MELLADRAFT_123542 [Melampsora larici-populina 98AG31]EGG11006.1 secreted protein [Melampsora larici-populina 98AG31]
MLHVFLKISFLFLCLWIHVLNGRELIGCNRKLEKLGPKSNTAVCEVDNGKITTYHCKYASCWNDNHQWVFITGCQLPGSDGAFSDQDCAQYEYLGVLGYGCTNPGNVTYRCPYWDPTTVPYLTCSDCTLKK